MMKVKSSTVYEKIVLDLNNTDLSQYAIAKKYNVSQAYVSNIKTGDAKRHESKKVTSIDAVQNEQEETKRYSDLRARFSLLQNAYRQIEAELSIRKDFDAAKHLIIPERFSIKQHTKHDATAFALISDWHVDEIVKIEEVSGVNEYNHAICKERIADLFDVIIQLTSMCKSKSIIKTLVVDALGDFIGGYLHLDLIQSNEITPIEAVIRVVELMTGGLDLILKASIVDEIIFSGVVGNHGRITQKPPTKKSAEKNYEWLVYEFLMRLYAAKKEERIKFMLPKGMFNWLDVYGYQVRSHHGDAIRYQGGVGGIHIPLRKAIAQWNKARHADLDCLGHWHIRENSKDYCLNGSAIGYNQFAMRIKADYEPPQQSFFILRPLKDMIIKTAEFPMIL